MRRVIPERKIGVLQGKRSDSVLKLVVFGRKLAALELKTAAPELRIVAFGRKLAALEHKLAALVIETGVSTRRIGVSRLEKGRKPLFLADFLPCKK